MCRGRAPAAMRTAHGRPQGTAADGTRNVPATTDFCRAGTCPRLAKPMLVRHPKPDLRGASMLEKRSHKQDVVALVLLALSVFLAIALLSYNPADPPSNLVYPQHAKIANACGRSGAVAAEWLLQSVGLGAYFLVFSLAALDAALLSRRQVSDPWFRAAGWGLALLGVTTLLAMGFHGATPGPVIGPGGYLGAAARTILEMHFAQAGAFILAISLTLGRPVALDRLLGAARRLLVGLDSLRGNAAREPAGARHLAGSRREIEVEVQIAIRRHRQVEGCRCGWRQ